MERLLKNSKGQVWVETVVYTLIALALIGAVLAFAKPKIEEMQDKAVIEQSLVMLENIDSQVLSVVQGGAGNKRIVRLEIKKGELKVDSELGIVSYVLTGNYKYSEVGEEVEIGQIGVTTEEVGRDYMVTLKIDYNERYEILYGNDASASKVLPKAATPYKLSIENLGETTDGEKIKINFGLI